MTNLGILLKNNFNIFLGKLKGKNRKSTKSAILTLIFSALFIIVFYSFQGYTMFDDTIKNGIDTRFPIYNACLTTLSLLVILGITRATQTRKSIDDDFLLSLPISKSEIILSKTMSKYLFDLAFAIMLLTSYVVIYQIFLGLNITLIVTSFFCILFLPLFSVGISYILSFIISNLFNKLKYGNILKSVIITLSLLALIWILTTNSNYESITNYDEFFENSFFTNILLEFLTKPALLSILNFLCLTLIPFTIGALLFGSTFGKSFSAYRDKSKTLKFTESKSPFKLLIKKELTNYISTPIYVVNTIIGPLIILGFSIFGLVVGIDGFNEIMQLELPKEIIAGAIALVFCFAISTTSISSATISLEGRAIYLLKSLPISVKTLLNAKATFHILIIEPFVLVGTIICTIGLSLSLLQAFFVFLIPTLLCLIMAYSGLLFNLIWPNFTWTDVTQVIKQGASVLINILLGFVLTAIPVALFLLCGYVGVTTICLITAIIYLAILFVTLLMLHLKGYKLFKKL